MIVVEYQKIELDHCLRCAGVWFDSGELDLLISSLETGGAKMPEPDLLAPHHAKVDEARRKCPVCGRKMDKVWLGKEPKVLIDSCPLGEGFWFDGGELHEVLRQVEPAGSKDILSFLGQAFQATHNGKRKT